MLPTTTIQLMCTLACVWQLLPTLSSAKSSTGPIKKSKIWAVFEQAINKSVNPCDDFYEFACGSWKSNNPIPKGLTIYDEETKAKREYESTVERLLMDNKTSSLNAIKVAKKFFSKCMDLKSRRKTNSSTLVRKLEEYGYWPILHGDKWVPSKYDLTDLLAKVTARVNPLIQLLMGNTITDDYPMGVLPGDLLLKDPNYYLNETYSEKLTGLADYMKRKVMLLASDAYLDLSESDITSDINSIIEFEKNLAKIMPDPNFHHGFRTVPFQDLSKDVFPEVDWERMFETMQPGSPYHLKNLTFYFTDPEYFVNLGKLLNETDKRTVANYILWHYVINWDFYLDIRHAKLGNTFLQLKNEEPKKASGRKACALELGKFMKDIRDLIFISSHFKKEDYTRVKKIVDNVKNELKFMLKQNAWMSNTTKNHLLHKIDKMIIDFSIGNSAYNTSEIDNNYAEYYQYMSDDGDYAAMTDKFLTVLVYYTLRINPEQFTNLTLERIKNTRIVPAELLPQPFFRPSYPKGMIYGGFASKVSSILFLTSGMATSIHDEDGEWWDELSEFNARAKCFGGTLNKKSVIAEIFGLKYANLAYQKSKLYLKGNSQQMDQEKTGNSEYEISSSFYTDDQIFYISYANTKCGVSDQEHLYKRRYMVNEVVMNQPTFATAFNCPADSPMNPKNKCSVW